MDQDGGVLGGKVAFVTGAARGLGLHMANALVGAGARVALVARSADKLRQEAERLGPSALAVPTDISDPDSVRRAFATTVDAFGGLDILVNNATLNVAHKVEQIADEELKAEVGVNIMGAVYCMRDAVPLMRARGGGDIVNISSESLTRPFPFLALYAACKAAIENLTMGMREEVRAENIRVTTLRSGTIASVDSTFLDLWDPERFAQFREQSAAFGYSRDVGTAIPPQITAKALVDVLTLPREAHIDMICVRSV